MNLKIDDLLEGEKATGSKKVKVWAMMMYQLCPNMCKHFITHTKTDDQSAIIQIRLLITWS